VGRAENKPVSPAIGAKKLYGLAGRKVHRATITKQLNTLQRKGLISIKDNGVIALKEFKDFLDLFDHKRSLAGRKGARRRLLYSIWTGFTRPSIVPKSVSYYLSRVLIEAGKLISRRERAAALDLITHTLLLVRENGILWLWYRDKFIYYEPKNKPVLHRGV